MGNGGRFALAALTAIATTVGAAGAATAHTARVSASDLRTTPMHGTANPRFWRVLVPKRPSGKRMVSAIEGASTAAITFTRDRSLSDHVRVRTGRKYVRRAVSVERRRIDDPGSWIVADRGLTNKRGGFNADLVPGGLGTWQFRYFALKEPGAKVARAPGETLTFVSSHTATETLWDQVSAGGAHTCALATTGKPYCWGYGGFGALGNGGLGLVTIPSPVTTAGVLANVTLKQISAGGAHTCALDTQGRAYCWGEGSSGQLGDGKGNDTTVPVRVDISGALKNVALESLSTGANRTCGVGANGRIYCWGDGSTGALGTGQTATAVSPVAAVDPPGQNHPFVAVTTDGGHTCGLRDNGVALCWGSGGDGQIGNGKFVDQLRPDRVMLDDQIKSISAGSRSTCAVTADGVGYCWGAADNGRLGGGQTTATDTPARINATWLGGAPLSQVTSGDAYSCSLTTGAVIGCWGINRNGQLGVGHTVDASWPVPLPGLINVRELSTGTRHACAVTNDGRAYCWGNDANGELGNSTFSSSTSPFQVFQPLS